MTKDQLHALQTASMKRLAEGRRYRHNHWIKRVEGWRPAKEPDWIRLAYRPKGKGLEIVDLGPDEQPKAGWRVLE